MKESILIIKNSETGEEARTSVESAVFSVVIETEGWDSASNSWVYGQPFLRVRYSLEMEVDEHSGEDGAPQPVINDIPVYDFFDGQNPELKQLIGKTIDISDDDWDWDAWFGNDASGLIDNSITFSKWENNLLHIHWTAACDYEEESIEFIGAATFDGIKVQVKNPGDETLFIRELFGDNLDLNDWNKEDDGILDYGEFMPTDRRKWYKVVYIPKTSLAT